MVKISLLAQIIHKVRLLYIFVREQMFYKKAQSFLGECTILQGNTNVLGAYTKFHR